MADRDGITTYTITRRIVGVDNLSEDTPKKTRSKPSITVRRIGEEVEIILTRAPGEDNAQRPVDLMAIIQHEIQLRRRNPVSHNEWMLLVSGGGAALGAAFVQAIFHWLGSRNGRTYRYKRGDEEWQAPSEKELRSLMRSAGEEVEVRVLAAAPEKPKQPKPRKRK